MELFANLPCLLLIQKQLKRRLPVKLNLCIPWEAPRREGYQQEQITSVKGKFSSGTCYVELLLIVLKTKNSVVEVEFPI